MTNRWVRGVAVLVIGAAQTAWAVPPDGGATFTLKRRAQYRTPARSRCARSLELSSV